MKRSRIQFFLAFLVISAAIAQTPSTAERFTITGQKLTWEGDLASKMVDGVDRFLLRKLSESKTTRETFWKDVGDAEHPQVVAATKKLKHILGLREDRPTAPRMQLVETFDRKAEVHRTDRFRVLRVRWTALSNAMGEIRGEGLLLEPLDRVKTNVVAIPDCDQTPEEIVNAYANSLAASQCRVIIPSLVSRQVEQRRNAELTNREYLYRSSFELGRQLAGYELQKVLACVDWFSKEHVDAGSTSPQGVIGWGEGGRLALYAAAVDPRVDVVCVSGYFGPREGIWKEPIDRNVFGLLNQFGDAELASLAALHDTDVLLHWCRCPDGKLATRGGAPYELSQVVNSDFRAEIDRIALPARKHVITSESSDAGVEAMLELFVTKLGVEQHRTDTTTISIDEVDSDRREARQIREIERYNQALLTESPSTRVKYFEKHDTSSVESHEKTIEPYRETFRREVIGQFDEPLLPANPRSRQVYDSEKWTGHEVVLDVFPDVFAFGILLLPKGIADGERRPVVVCQHGLEGRPRNVIEQDHPAYHDYAAKLAERGFITFAPQNIYIFRDRFRTLQRKANPLGKTLFSIMVPQHQQIVDWLATLPQVDPERIAFYGLSYGGKSAMRIPPLVDRYCLSICSADFNDWVWKNASTRTPYSYVWTGEYEIFEWDLGSTFNYAEMAALIAPRPFMVERGHFDGVAPDERVALEFAKVRHLYQAKLGIGDRCEIEFFVGPHTINGKATFDFLHRHLRWP